MSQLIIGLGHRARQGKDYAAQYIANTFGNVHILHWADALYKEVQHIDHKDNFPLIKKEGNIYSVFDTIGHDGSPIHRLFTKDEVPKLDKIFSDRGIFEYEGMEEKDSELLQFWGTDYRRKIFGANYWVNRTLQDIKSIDDNSIIVIPDTRFFNEFDTIKFMDGIYVEVERYNLDNSRYYANDRDPNHPSENELDDISYDYIIKAQSGDVKTLRDSIINIVKTEAVIRAYALYYKENIESVTATIAVA